jgi:hypothetical protein
MATYRQGLGLVHRVHALGPTTREDGTPLSPDEVSHYIRILRYQDSDPIEQAVQLIEDANTPEYDGEFDEAVDIDSQEPGQYAYSYRTVDKDGRESKPSEVAFLEILPPLQPPNPPTDCSFV